MLFNLFGHDVEVWKALMTLGILLVAAEIFIPSFIALPIGLALMVTAAFTPLLSSISAVLLLLAINLIVMLFVFQWILKKKLSSPDLPSNADALINKEATALSEISSTPGQAKVFSEVWTAVSENSEVISAGAKVLITRTDGNKLIVRKKI